MRDRLKPPRGLASDSDWFGLNIYAWHPSPTLFAVISQSGQSMLMDHREIASNVDA